MDENRYHEILPVAFMVAALEKGKIPSSVSVGRAARAIEEMEREWDGAYRIAMAQRIPAEIIKVERVTTSFGVDKFHIAYRPLRKDAEVEEMNTPLVNHKTLGASTNAIWNRFNEDGANEWNGKRMMLMRTVWKRIEMLWKRRALTQLETKRQTEISKTDFAESRNLESAKSRRMKRGWVAAPILFWSPCAKAPGDPASTARKRGWRHPRFHVADALAPAKAALRVLY